MKKQLLSLVMLASLFAAGAAFAMDDNEGQASGQTPPPSAPTSGQTSSPSAPTSGQTSSTPKPPYAVYNPIKYIVMAKDNWKPMTAGAVIVAVAEAIRLNFDNITGCTACGADEEEDNEGA